MLASLTAIIDCVLFRAPLSMVIRGKKCHGKLQRRWHVARIGGERFSQCANITGLELAVFFDKRV
jgi:hypothetical protein